jgi:hypothetical protein
LHQINKNAQFFADTARVAAAIFSLDMIMVEIAINGKEKVRNCVPVCDISYNPPMLSNKFGAGAVLAGAALTYGSGSTKMMQLRIYNTFWNITPPFRIVQ